MPNENTQVGFNVNAFVRGNEEHKELTVAGEPPSMLPALAVVETAKKRGRKPKEASTSEPTKVEIVEAPQPQTSMSYLTQNIPYQAAYVETNQQLDESIAQLNALGMETMADLQSVRASKTMKGKFAITRDLTEVATGIINAKISAIKEKNKTINDVNNIELRRIKELKLDSADAGDDVTRISNLYSAFVNAPISQGFTALGPTPQSLTMMGGVPAPRAVIDNGPDASTAAWEAALPPSQKLMLMNAKGISETVLIYDQETGNRRFAVLDKQTGQEIQGVETPSQDRAYQVDINLRGGYAKETTTGAVYPLRVVGNVDPNVINQY